jgi:hypothetical protein
VPTGTVNRSIEFMELLWKVKRVILVVGGCGYLC